VLDYANDVDILIGEKSLNTDSALMQAALNCVHNWCGGVGLNVNADKIVMILFQKGGVWKGLSPQGYEQSGQVSVSNLGQ
jgi:hypothetical protein